LEIVYVLLMVGNPSTEFGKSIYLFVQNLFDFKARMLAAPCNGGGCGTQEGQHKRQEARKHATCDIDGPFGHATSLELFPSATCWHAVHAEYESLAEIRVRGGRCLPVLLAQSDPTQL